MRRWLILAVAVIGLAGCAVAAPTPLPPELIPDEPVVDCRAPASTCTTAVDDARMQVTGGVVPIAVQVVCKPGCTVLDGEADVVVRYSDGSTSSYTTGWSGAVPAVPGEAPRPMPIAPTCQGVPEPTCTEMAQAGWESAGGDGVVSIVVRCAAAGGCTQARGEGETTVTYADGRNVVSGWGYEGAAP